MDNDFLPLDHFLQKKDQSIHTGQSTSQSLKSYESKEEKANFKKNSAPQTFKKSK